MILVRISLTWRAIPPLLFCLMTLLRETKHSDLPSPVNPLERLVHVTSPSLHDAAISKLRQIEFRTPALRFSLNRPPLLFQLKLLKHQAVTRRKDTRFAVALDSEQNSIQCRDVVKVVEGPHVVSSL